MVTLLAPQAPPRWDHSPEEVVSLVKEAISQKTRINDQIAALHINECTFESVFVALAEAEGALQAVTESMKLYEEVSPEKALRKASIEATTLTNDFNVEDKMRLDVFRAKANAEKNVRESSKWESLTTEEKRIVERMVLEGKRAGLALPDEEREKLAQLQKELSAVCTEFGKNLNEEKRRISFTLEELDGVPQDSIDGYTKTEEDDKVLYECGLNPSDIFPIMKYANNPATRKRAFETREGRLSINVPLFDRALELRRQIASILGYACWADYITEIKMVKTGKNAADFLDDLVEKLRPIGERERENLLSIKKEDCQKRGFPFDGYLNVWDESYYTRIFTEKTLQFDTSPLKEYFPVAVIVPKILEIYQHMFSVRFVEVAEDKKNVWHPEVRQIELWDKDAKSETDFIGHVYLDLYPRPNKWAHASCWPLIPARDMPAADGRRGKHIYPVTAIIANLAKPTPTRPALAPHNEVWMFFHEMGHVFHAQLSRAVRFARFSGVEVARDFEEAPSQMLENWCWEPSVLEKMTSHYETQDSMPRELIDKLVKARYLNVGLFQLRQVSIARYDVKVHTDKEVKDTTKLWNELRQDIALVKSGNYQPGQVSFGHMMRGYDVGYYGYMYSLVYSTDMYTVFKSDPLSPELGRRYRDEILNVGGTRDEIVSLTRFLGREPNANAFKDVVSAAVQSNGM